MGFYSGELNWSLWSTVSLVRMADTVDAAMNLMIAGKEVDGRARVRSLYEQVVTFAWIAIDPGPRFSRCWGKLSWDELHLHNDALTFGVGVLSQDEVAKTKQLLGLTDESDLADEAEAPACSGESKRSRPDATRLLPPVPDRAREADEHWSSRISGLHPPGHMLGFCGLYLPAFRTASRSVHSAMGGRAVYVTDKPNRKVVHVAKTEGSCGR